MQTIVVHISLPPLAVSPASHLWEGMGKSFPNI
jgi:hypothetical protein